MIAALVLWLWGAADDGFADSIKNLTDHTKCEVREVYRTSADAARMVFFTCPDARLVVGYEKTPEGKWTPVPRVYSAPLVWPAETVEI